MNGALAQSVSLDEPFFIEVNREKRKAEGFVGNWQALRRELVGADIRVQEVLVGPARLFLKVNLPKATYAQRNALIARLRSQPVIAGVWAASSANLGLFNHEQLERLGPQAVVAENKLRGFREKRRDHRAYSTAPRTGEILVKYLEGECSTVSKRAAARGRVAALHARHGASIRRTIDTDTSRIEVVQLPAGADFDAALKVYLDSPDVEYAQPNYVYSLSFTPNDARFGELWGMQKIQAPAAWDVRWDATPVIVAVVDTGIDYNHPDLQANMWVNPNPDPNNPVDGTYGANLASRNRDPMDDHNPVFHGTHCAGIIGAVGNNGIGVAGVAHRIKLMAVKIFNSAGGTTTADIVDGLDYARTKGAHIVSASWGSSPGNPVDELIKSAIGRLRDANIIFVNSAGNSANDNDVVPGYPGGSLLTNMVVVGNSTQTDERNYSSSFGRWSVDVFAPGTSILSTMQGNRYQPLSGTSMAAPHVSGLLALEKAQFPWESMSETIDRVRFSVDAVPAFDSDSLAGGRLNASKALSTRPLIANLSTRCQVNTGDGIAIAGTYVVGPVPKRVAFRALGPTLGSYGVPDTLANPTITVFTASGQLIGQNDDWVTLSAADRAELAAHGQAPSFSEESAWVGTLPPGGYSVHLSGVAGGTGVGIVEVFDFDGGTQTRLINVSTRCFVGTGGAVAIGGTWITGDKPRQVYIRALGPTLTQYGVGNALQDPVITLYDNTTGQQVATNDDWRDWDGGSTAVETRLDEYGKPPPDNRESAMVVRLNPGPHTVVLTGKNGTTGIGIVEIYEY